MTIEYQNQIDFISLNEKKGFVQLIIADHLEWSLNEKKLILLQNKINFYLAYIESGDMTLAHPASRFLNPIIKLASKFEPNQKAICFLYEVTALIEEAGYSFEWDVLTVDKGNNFFN